MKMSRWRNNGYDNNHDDSVDDDDDNDNDTSRYKTENNHL